MSATASSRVDRWLFPAWVAFAAINIALMFVMPGKETVPFHFVWISLSIVYGLQPWRLRRSFVVLAAVCLVTGAALVRHVQNDVIGWGGDDRGPADEHGVSGDGRACTAAR
jgi:lysylphosphatidylglycerol synthetase-like protein (DUF2156 family)